MGKLKNNFLCSDDALFHYTKKTTALEKILPSGQLRFGSFQTSNDPYEYRNKWQVSENEEHIISKIDQSKSMAQFLFRKSYSYRYFLRRIGFLSFCINDVAIGIYGYDRLRMWAQYGDNHSGICLVYSKSELLSELYNFFPKDSIISQSVSYKLGDDKNRAAFRIKLDKDYKNETYPEKWEEHLRKYQNQLLFTKNRDFSDESEFRIVLHDREENLQRTFPFSDSLKAIIVGDQFPNIYHLLLKDFKLRKREDIRLYRLLWSMDTAHLFSIKV